MSDEYNTTLAFVHTAPDGDRDFSFYRKTGADAFLKKESIKAEVFKNARIFHFGTLSMTNPVVNEATEFALERAKNAGLLISFDPNLRKPLWDSLEKAKERIWYGISVCNILKISEDELEFITGEKDIKKGISAIREKNKIPLITVTMGKNGSASSYLGKNGSELFLEAETFSNVKTIDTTGAGDTFCACILHEILKNGYEDFSMERMRAMLRFANAASSLITTRKGALCVMPDQAEILKLIEAD